MEVWQIFEAFGIYGKSSDVGREFSAVSSTLNFARLFYNIFLKFHDFGEFEFFNCSKGAIKMLVQKFAIRIVDFYVNRRKNTKVRSIS